MLLVEYETLVGRKSVLCDKIDNHEKGIIKCYVNEQLIRTIYEQQIDGKMDVRIQ